MTINTSLPFLVAKKTILCRVHNHLCTESTSLAQDTMIGTMRTRRSPTATVNTCTSEWEALIFLKYLLQSKLIIYQQSLPVIICTCSTSLNIQKNKPKTRNENTISPPPHRFWIPKGFQVIRWFGRLSKDGASAAEVSTPSCSQSWSSSWNRCMASWCRHVQGFVCRFFSSK